ncbi:MAG: hypothetical protein KIS67_28500 [Verrucomicrobiae bacterium]|nr:hypothetical protein [Verrucomicrobiae bacterium]
MSGILELLNSAGTVIASEPAGITNLTYTIPAGQAGQYYARIRGASGTEGLFSQYLLSLELIDLLPPTILTDTLPTEGGSVLGLFDRFTLTFSEDMLAVTVNDANSYELRASGPDNLFDTVDDVLWTVNVSPAYSAGLTANYVIVGGALQPGHYRFTAKTDLQDRAGNPLSPAHVRQFAVNQVLGFNTEIEPNNTRETARPLAMESTQPNLISGAGRGYLSGSGDWDFWSFEAQAGDTMVLAAQNPGNPGSSGLTYILYDPSGTQLFNTTSANNGLLQTDPLVLTNAGVFTVRVSYWYGYYNEYRLRVSLYRNELLVEQEANESLGTANPLTFVTEGNTRRATVGGYARLASDLDYFNLGNIEAGQTVFLGTRQPASSPLIPVVSVYNANNVYLPEAGSGRPSDGVAEVRIEQTGTYYALVRSTAGSDGLMSEYILDVLALPTEDVIFPNLQVTQLQVPVTTGLQSGDPFTFWFTVANVGSLATPASVWFDRAVLSLDPVMDESDVVLGLYQHTGALAPGASYNVTNTLNLPDGISGSFYLIVKADYTDTVNEFILEGDNETATENPLAITLANYPDLVIEDFNVNGPDGQTYTISWNTFNRGTAAVTSDFIKERVRVRNQTTATTIFDQTYAVAGPLAVNASMSRQVDFMASTPGLYLVEVTTDSDQDIYEFNAISHENAENNTVTTTFAITQFHDVTLSVAPAGAGIVTGAGTYAQGASVTVTATPVTTQAPYFFLNWTEGGIVRSANASYTFTINQNANLVAVFALPTYQLSASNHPPLAGTVIGAGTYVWGTTNPVTAQPAFGYKFSHWSENGVIVGSNATLHVPVYSNRLVVAHYADAHLVHEVTTATVPAGLATVSGAGSYTNGESTTISAPVAVTNAPPNYYAFKRFTLNGTPSGTNASFLKTFATTDPTNMHYVAEYEFVDRTPPAISDIAATPGVSSAAISWKTDELASSRVEYGLTAAYGTLNSSSLLRTQHNISLAGLSPATLYHFRVRSTDAATNETVSADGTFTTLAAPDLTPGALAAPASAPAGTMIPLTFVISNIGPGTAFGPWQNAVLLSPNADGSGAQTLGAVSFNPGAGGIAAGASITATQNVIVPALPPGLRYLGLRADSGNQLFEINEDNNVAFAAAPLNIVAIDLRVARVTAPATAEFGQTVPVEFVVTNAGSAPASFTWTDRLYLSPASNILATLLNTMDAGVVPLTAGASYTNSVNASLPHTTASTPGLYHLVLAADHGNAIAESDENNNLGSTPITLSLPPMADLAVVNVNAPTNAAPGQTLPLTWTTINQGSVGVAGAWSETVFLATNSAGIGGQELATLAFTNALAVGGAITRTQLVTIPSSGILGNLWLAVQADSRGDVIELNEANNLGVATNSTLVPAVLTLQLSISQVTEGASQPVVATVTRNGSRAAPLTVTLNTGDPTEVSLPAQVIIAAGQASASFNIVALADGEVDGSQVVTIGASAAGFDSAEATLTVLDANLPQLSLQPFAGQILEGEVIAALIMRNGGTNAAVQVAVNSSSPGQLSVVSPVTIPAGEYFTHTEIRALEDTLVEAPLGVSVTVSTPGYHPGTTNITVFDNDWPALTLAIAPDTVSEGAGPQAAMATLTRASVSARPLDVELQSSNTNALRVPFVVTIPSGTTVITFPVAAVNNDLVDGDKNVEVRAWFRASGSANRLGDPLIVPVTVTDDDGPTLRLAFSQSLVAEGLDPAATGTLTRNAGTNAALLVSLVSSDATELIVPATVTIPVGAFSAQFDAVSVADGETDGNQTVTVTASAAGFTTGAAQITVSDINLPDLVVASVAAPATAATEEYVDLGYQIRNQGAVASPSNAIVQRIYLSSDPFAGDDILLNQLTLNASLPAGSQFGQSFSARMPQAAGNYWIIVETDVLNNVAEIVENNNVSISPNPIQVSPAYSAVVATTLETAPANTPVPLTGQATRPGGLPAQFALVNIHISVRETTRTIAAITDGSGNFATTWQPLPGEAGYYEIAASHPGAAAPAAQDSFYLLGMKAQPAQPSVRLSEGSSVGGTVAILNLSDVPLTGLAVEALNVPPNVNATLTLETNHLAGSATIQLGYGISALNATFTTGHIIARLTSVEGALLEFPIRVTIDALVPRLVAYPGRLEGGMKRGDQRTVSFQIANTGGLETGPVIVSLPALPWMSLASPNPMPSLAPGETNTVTLHLNPPEDISLTIHQGNLAVNGVGTGVAVPFSFRALSEAKGDLLITSVDEFTYYGAGSPPLTNATVRVRDAVSRSVVTNGVTDASGRFFVPQLMEGYYDLELDAEQHNGHRSTIFVEPGLTNEVTAFLSYQAVRYTWTVERIEIEDHYRITIETEFETVVPAPVVTIDPPVLDVSDLKIVGQTKQVNMTFRNHGLIAADDVQLRFSSHPFYSIEPLIGDIGRLPAKSSLTIPVTLRRIGDFPSPVPGQVRVASGVPCGMSGNTSWSFECGPLSISGGAPVAVSGVSGDCGGGPGGGPGGGGFGPGWGGPGGGLGGGGVNTSYSSPSIGLKLGCDPECLAIAILSCIPGPIGCAAGGAACGGGLAQGVSALSVVDCAIGLAGCVVPGAGVPACIYSLLRCFIGPAGGSPEISLASDDTVDYFKAGVRAQLDAFNLMTGSPDGVWLNPMADPTTGDWYARFQAACAEASDDERFITPDERAELLAGEQPTGVPPSEVVRLLDRWNRTLENVALGILRPADAPPGANLDFIDTVALREKLVLAAAYQAEAEAAGFTDSINAIVDTIRYRAEEGEEGGVCARVKIKLDQEAVLSREAFLATLEIDNATANTLSDIRVIVRVTDGLGNDANEMFGLRPPELTGLSDVDGGGSVAGGAKGTARWTLVPTVDAAPLEPVQYFVGGEFRYTLNGLVVTVPLSPVPITVNPTARLTLDYFHQRDVYSDDPFTDVVEPSIPFNLAVMVNNWGAGEAKNFRITSAQPEIVENEKGLLIDFRIIATEVAGQNLTPTLTANFGTIPPGGISVARWLMTSTLQGLFINYSATFEHLDGQGNPRLSLIDEVRIHEMIRLVQARGPFEDGKPDFLVNDKPDLRDLPDTLWLSDGSSNYVAVVTNAVITGALSPGNLQVPMTVEMPPGWAYLRVPDPADGQYRLAQVVRSDSFSVGVETNAWVTDRTFLGQGKRPKQENILHLLDHDSTGQYTLIYELLPTVDDEPPVSSVAALPGESQAVFLLSWSGQDNAGGSGIASYDVYFSEDGGAFQRWLAGTPTTSSVFQGTLGKTYAFYSVAVDNAGNREPAPAAPQAQTTVAFVNQPPILAAIPTQVIPEGETFSLTLSATDPDGDSLTYQLGAGAPAGMLLNSQSGLLTWLTGELHGPSTNQITVTARDTGIPQLSDTLTFSLIVLESNTPPVLAPIASFTVAEGALLTFTNVASDVDLPAQQLTFSLGAGAPAGAAVHPVSGVFTWQPNQTQGGVTNLISVIVTDDGPPALSATQTFAVIVIDTQPDFSLGIGTTAIWSNGVGNVALTLQSGVDLNQLQLVLAVTSGRLTNLNLSGLAPQIGSANLIPLGADRFNVQFDKQSGALLQGNLTLGQLGFAAVPDESSAIAVLRGESLQGVRADSLQSVEGQAGLGRVFIVGREPILDAAPAVGGQVALTLYGHPGQVYTLERTVAVGGAPSWSFDSLVTAVGLRTDLPLRPASGPIEFFRALEGTVGVILTIRLEGGQIILEWPLECAECVLEQSPALTGPAAVWIETAAQPSEVNGRYRVSLPVSGEQLFLRLAIPTP